MARRVSTAIAALLLVGQAACPLSRHHPLDEKRCKPACLGDHVCVNGKCTLLDGGVGDGQLSPDFPTSVPGTWVTVTKGTFVMGAPKTDGCRNPADELQHQITLTSGFEIQSTEVTQSQFSTLMGYNPSIFSSCGASCPVENITWYEAAAYCNSLSEIAGSTLCYKCTGKGKDVACQDAMAYKWSINTCPGYRLPTDAEWEYAYRAGTNSSLYNGDIDQNNCNTCWQKDVSSDKIGWYCVNSKGSTHPVGEKGANKSGLFDMAGNVWELCHDWYEPALHTFIDPLGPNTGSAHVMRGGSWNQSAANMRAARRGFVNPMARNSEVGFRCVRKK